MPRTKPVQFVYLHVDPLWGTVRYVGVGPKSRAYDWQARSKEHLAWLTMLDAMDLEPLVVFAHKTRNRSEAMRMEIGLIAEHRATGAPLFNMTNGGLGALGVKKSDVERAYLRDIQKTLWQDPFFRARRLPDMAKARALRNRSPEHRAAITKHPLVHGRPCVKCSNTLRYKVSRNCVACAKVP